MRGILHIGGFVCIESASHCPWLSIQDLKDLLRKAGDVTYADAHKQRTGEA